MTEPQPIGTLPVVDWTFADVRLSSSRSGFSPARLGPRPAHQATMGNAGLMRERVAQVLEVLAERVRLTALARAIVATLGRVQPPSPWWIVTEPVYLTPAEVGAILRVHPRTVLRLAQQDATMPATRLGTKLVRFEKAALDRWLARKRPRLAQGSTQAAGAAL